MVGYNGQHIPDFPGQQPWQDRAYQQFLLMQQQQQGQASAQPQAMSYPTIHADIVQTDDPGVIDRWGVSPGKSQMFMTHDESTITIKSIGGSGVVLDIYDKRPPAPVAPQFDPSAYVTKDELEIRLAAITTPKRAQKKETEATE